MVICLIYPSCRHHDHQFVDHRRKRCWHFDPVCNKIGVTSQYTHWTIEKLDNLILSKRYPNYSKELEQTGLERPGDHEPCSPEYRLEKREFKTSQTLQWYDSATDRTRAAASVERGLIVHLNGAGPLEHRNAIKNLEVTTSEAKEKTY